MANKTKTTSQKEEAWDKSSQTADAPLPLLDFSDAAVTKMIKQAPKRGLYTDEESYAVMARRRSPRADRSSLSPDTTSSTQQCSYAVPVSWLQRETVALPPIEAAIRTLEVFRPKEAGITEFFRHMRSESGHRVSNLPLVRYRCGGPYSFPEPSKSVGLPHRRVWPRGQQYGTAAWPRQSHADRSRQVKPEPIRRCRGETCSYSAHDRGPLRRTQVNPRTRGGNGPTAPSYSPPVERVRRRPGARAIYEIGTLASCCRC